MLNNVQRMRECILKGRRLQAEKWFQFATFTATLRGKRMMSVIQEIFMQIYYILGILRDGCRKKLHALCAV